MSHRKLKGSADETAFKRVIGYFLDHEKPKNEPPKAGKRIGKPRKPSTKAKKRA